MIVSRVILKNWRNFLSVDVQIGDRLFLVGPNASGKSNFLDVFRFLRDIAQPGTGGLKRAIAERGGLSKIRCLSAPPEEDIEIEVHLAESTNEEPIWKYAIGINQNKNISQSYSTYQTKFGSGDPWYSNIEPYLTYERVWQRNLQLINRPDANDEKNKLLMRQTYLEQSIAYGEFQEIVELFDSFFYLHLVPQLLRFNNPLSKHGIYGESFGGSFLERVAATPKEIREPRLRKIEDCLRIAIPYLQQFNFVQDEGIPHFEAIYESWKIDNAKQQEDQFSDGTLRLIGLVWSLLESNSLLLLEEPELSLDATIVAQLAPLMYRLRRHHKRQIIISTHSADLLLDEGIGGEEVLILKPDKENTKVELASSIPVIRDLLEGGLSIADAVLPLTSPPEVTKLSLFQ